ncbi:hypothetical protein [Rhizobium sp. ZX09]|uniref:hypothetical protein n=1 Tax=Rhizobium sp. ZX09 TaxID=2291939 RepID=UPI001FEE7FB1|nr:hypothetical protein [Rhizobium sp. ZX09]
MTTKKTSTGNATTVKTVAKAPTAKTDKNAPANISPATEFSPSGAPNQTVPDVDPAHVAVDADPRKGTSETQNRIDFNDPTISGQEAVSKNLNASE